MWNKVKGQKAQSSILNSFQKILGHRTNFCLRAVYNWFFNHYLSPGTCEGKWANFFKFNQMLLTEEQYKIDGDNLILPKKTLHKMKSFYILLGKLTKPSDNEGILIANSKLELVNQLLGYFKENN